MDAKIRDYLDFQNLLEAEKAKADEIRESLALQESRVWAVNREAECLAEEIIAEMESDGCLTADYDEGAPTLTRIAVVTRKQTPKPQSPDAVPDEYIVTKEVKSVNQAKIKADFHNEKVLPNWLKRDDDVKSLAIRYVKKG